MRAQRCLLAVAVAAACLPLSARAAGLTVTPDANPVLAGSLVTFRIDPKVLQSGDSVSFNFGDGGSGTIQYDVSCTLFGGCDTIQHAYAGAGSYVVAATGTIGGTAVSASLTMTVTGTSNDREIYVPAGAHVQGFEETEWRTDLDVHNPGAHQISYTIALLVRDKDNSQAQNVTFTLGPGQSAHYGDILWEIFHFTGAAALRILPGDGPLMVTSRTYNVGPTGTYGQFVQGVRRSRAVAYGQSARLIGLSHDPTLAQGFRTNLGFVNASPAPIAVEVNIYGATGVRLGALRVDLEAYEYTQIDRVLEQVASGEVKGAYAVVKTTTSGGTFFAYASVVDNLTGDAVFQPAVVPE